MFRSLLICLGFRIYKALALAIGGFAEPTLAFETHLSTANTYTVTNLLASSTYELSIAVINELALTGDATLSKVVAETGQLSVPSVSTGLRAAEVTGGFARIIWNSPVDTGGVSLTDLRYTLETSTPKTCLVDGACGSCTHYTESDALLVNTASCALAANESCPEGVSECCVEPTALKSCVVSTWSTACNFKYESPTECSLTALSSTTKHFIQVTVSNPKGSGETSGMTSFMTT